MKELLTRRDFLKIPFAGLIGKEDKDAQQDRRIGSLETRATNTETNLVGMALATDHNFKVSQRIFTNHESRLGNLEKAVFPEPDPNSPEIVPEGEMREL